MFKLKKKSILFNNDLMFKKANLVEQKPVRLQSTASDRTLLNDTSVGSAAKLELEDAKPFEQIPAVSVFTFLKGFLPGGKYANLDTTKMLLAFKDDFGDVARLPAFFGRPGSVITHNVEDFEKLLRNEGIWPNRPGSEALQYHRHVHRKDFFQGVEGLISTQGETWGTFRSAVNPVMMHPKNIRLYLHKMSQVNKEFVERIRLIRDPKTLEVPETFEEEIQRWTLESVSIVALDKQLGLITKNRDDPKPKELFQALNDFFELSLEIELKPSIWKYYKTSTFKRLMSAFDRITNTTSSYVNEAIERLEQESKSDKAEKPEQERSVLEKLIKIDKKIAAVIAMDMLMTGVDTTTSTLAGLLLCFAKNPDKQEKLRQEILKLLPEKNSEFDEEIFKNMPYLRACIKECLRLYPLVLGNGRVPINDVVISGYRVPKGTPVTFCSVSIMRDCKYYPRPNEFIPERWLRSNQGGSEQMKSSYPFLHLPFGFGPRSCIGRRIGEMEIELSIARLVRNFQIEFNHPTENAFKSLLINVPNIPLKFKFIDLDI